MSAQVPADPRPHWKQRFYRVIFESDSSSGQLFDVALLIAIVMSVAVVMLESVHSINLRYGATLRAIEWFFTGLFTLEYLLRLIVVRRPLTYMVSFLGVIDLLAILPTFFSLVIPGSRYLLTIRTLRLLRVFRILRLAHLLDEAGVITSALKASRFKILVFLCSVVAIVVVVGTLMYVIEGGKNGFTSIPTSIYWAVVTLTTVGYGDISPVTILGKTIASAIMILGYAIIAVPTGIVTAHLTHATAPVNPDYKQAVCHVCQATGHQPDAEFCRRCGEKL